MQGKLECDTPWFCIGAIDEDEESDNSTTLEFPEPGEIKTDEEWLAYIAKEDPKFIFGLIYKLSNFSLASCEKECPTTLDEAGEKIGLTADEFNFLMCFTTAVPH